MTLAEIIVMGGLGLALYTYVGYPLLLFLLSRFAPKQTQKADHTPFCSVIIAAHNEAASIRDKLENTLGLDYPHEQVEVIVASDGSSDDTEEIVNRYVSARVRLLRLPRCGKMRALELSAEQAAGDIIVFTDANTCLEPRALRALTAHFADPAVGGVCGCKRVGRTGRGTSLDQSEGFYWKYDQCLKLWESLAGSTIGADGSLYGIRRELFRPASDHALADDLVVSTRVCLLGRRLIFEPEAVTWEEAPLSHAEEFRRKVRVANHCMRALWELRAALNPFKMGLFALQLWSHKLLRYCLPAFLLPAFAASGALADQEPLYALLFAGQCSFYLLALFGALLRRRFVGRSRLLCIPFYFCLAHWAAFLAVLSLIRGERIVAWKHQRSAAVSR